jgi:hypothetical protein
VHKTNKQTNKRYLDSMGLLATLGHSVYVRQDLVGGNYGLLSDNWPFGVWVPRAGDGQPNSVGAGKAVGEGDDARGDSGGSVGGGIGGEGYSGGGRGGGGGDGRTVSDAHHTPLVANKDSIVGRLDVSGWQNNNTYTVLPDFWALLLWQRVMGTRVLRVSVTNTTGDSSTLRAYAHCAKEGPSGAVTLLLINIDPTAAVDVTLPAYATEQSATVSNILIRIHTRAC